jgi:hypothetical protein
MTTEKQTTKTVDACVGNSNKFFFCKTPDISTKDDGLKRRSVTGVVIAQHEMEQDMSTCLSA